MSKTTAELRAELAEYTATLARLATEQAAQRFAASALVNEGERALAALDEVTTPLEHTRQRVLEELSKRRLRTVGIWEIDDRSSRGILRWERSSRYLVGREHAWYTHAAWLRVGLWLPQPRWFLDVRSYVCGDKVKGGQHDLGAPVESDPNDGVRVRALADAVLIEAGYLLVEHEE